MKETKHTPVMLDEVMQLLKITPGGNYIDATLGGGGYSEELLQRCAPNGKVLAIDLNEDALETMRERFGSGSRKHEKRKPSFRSRSEPVPEGGGVAEDRLVLSQGNFRNIAAIARSHNFYDVSGVVFDLGLSSDLLEGSGRGFSFKRDEPLLMTFSGSENGNTALHVINTYSEEELERIFSEYGEERQSRNIARYIVEKRKSGVLATSGILADTVAQAVGRHNPKVLARIFQAVRIEVNEELAALEEGLEGAWGILGPAGRISVVSYHSLEDRIVKNFFRSRKQEGTGLLLTPKPVRPSETEAQKNPRSRSARLRGAEKVHSGH